MVYLRRLVHQSHACPELYRNQATLPCALRQSPAVEAYENDPFDYLSINMYPAEAIFGFLDIVQCFEFENQALQ